VLALIVSGAFFTSGQEYKGGRNQLIEQRAFAVAEYGLNSEVSNWDRSRNLPNGMAVGAVDSSHVYVAAGDTARVRITRLTDKSFWVISEGSASIGNAKLESKRATNAYVRLAYPSITPKGAITTAGDVAVTGSAVINGNNTNPPGWGQCASLPGSTVPAIVAGPAASVTYKAQNIVSTPAVVRDSTAVDSNTYLRYGTESWNSLVSNADIKLVGGIYNSSIGPVGTATTCDKSNSFNWGEPYRPGTIAGCYGYYPIIYSASSLKLNGNGYGQGILLVNGDFEINGKFEWYGLVIVRDDITKGNGTAQIMGAVYSANLNLADPTNFIAGNQDVLYSKCAVESALRGSSILVRVKERHWSQVQ
ncbi:MAG: hypothetical protein ABIT38_22585, partial [Gemmatimonadaceae bacterium]